MITLVAVVTVTLSTLAQPGETPSPVHNEIPSVDKIATPQAKKPGEEISTLKTQPKVELVSEPKVAASKAQPQPANRIVGDIETIVRQAARANGLDEDHFVSIARCESGMNPNAVNYGYNENGYPSGLFQHLSGYWPARAAQYGYAGASVFDAKANAYVTAAMWASGSSNLWECQ